jgi:hypothetical protein
MSTENNAAESILPPPIILHRRNEKYVLLSDGEKLHPIFVGGTFAADNGENTIEDINMANDHIQLNGRWYSKGEFEPATVIKTKCRRKCKGRVR